MILANIGKINGTAKETATFFVYTVYFWHYFYGEHCPTPVFGLHPHELHQQHIGHGAAKDGDEHLALPHVKNAGHGNADELRQAVTSARLSDC